MRWVGTAARALRDRKGVTSVEYAMIAALATTIVSACYNAIFNRMGAMIATIVFP